MMAPQPTAWDCLLGACYVAAIAGLGLVAWAAIGSLVAAVGIAAVLEPWATGAAVAAVAAVAWLYHLRLIRRPFLLASVTVWVGAWAWLALEAL